MLSLTNSIMTNKDLSTQISDDLLQQLRNFLDSQADLVSVGSDPAQAHEPNAALQLLTALDAATDGEFKCK
jgi:hypothetical protein